MKSDVMCRIVDNEEIIEVVPEQYKVPTTGAVMTYPSSIEKIHQFCSTLPTDKYPSRFKNHNIS